MTHIDELRKALDKVDDRVSGFTSGNYVSLTQTPGAWGKSADVAKSAAVQTTTMAANVIQTMISRGTVKIDIVSLQPPTGKLREAVFKGIKAVSAATSEKQMVLVRLLFGFIPGLDEKKNKNDDLERFRDELLAYCNSENISGSLSIFVGRYSYTGTSLAWNLDVFWNHSKIVAVDACEALVGGHNLQYQEYGDYPPVHDLSAYIHGPAAASAHKFADYLWEETFDKKFLEVWKYSRSAKSKAWEYEKLGGAKNRDWFKSTYNPAEASPVNLRTYGSPPYPNPATRSRTVPSGKTGNKALSVGRIRRFSGNSILETWGLEEEPSDLAKKTLILNAKKTLKIAQQDLVFRAYQNADNHKTCMWIAQALNNNLSKTSPVDVKIVVSPRGAASRSEPYSWGSGAAGTLAVIAYHLVKLGVTGNKLRDAMKHLTVAPFSFTDRSVMSNWPNTPAQPTFTESSAELGFIPARNGPAVKPTPAFHAKLYMADDETLYIGSDNMYPNPHAEFGFLYEGDVVHTFASGYWNPLWKYSEMKELAKAVDDMAWQHVKSTDDIKTLKHRWWTVEDATIKQNTSAGRLDV